MSRNDRISTWQAFCGGLFLFLLFLAVTQLERCAAVGAWLAGRARVAWILATMALVGCGSSQSRLCTALDAAGAALTAEAKVERTLIADELDRELDRVCSGTTTQLEAIACVERVRARVVEAHRGRYQQTERFADAQRQAALAHAKDCGGVK